MKRVLMSLAVLGVVALSASPLAAQKAALYLGGGGVMPTGNYAQADNTGWQLQGGLEIGIPHSPFAVRADAMYGETSHQGSIPFTNDTKLSGLSADGVYHIGGGMVPVKLYVLAGVGYHNVNLGSGASESDFSWNAGGGLRIGLGPMNLFAEARYTSIMMTGGSLNFFPITGGLEFGL
ncbi:MAG TPA: outer membrane beta-barrel protein [Gemmatimonadales bacterium]|nr:outer membrane beta-barrel protein [Gemmatimonadales bacterium]